MLFVTAPTKLASRDVSTASAAPAFAVTPLPVAVNGIACEESAFVCVTTRAAVVSAPENETMTTAWSVPGPVHVYVAALNVARLPAVIPVGALNSQQATRWPSTPFSAVSVPTIVQPEGGVNAVGSSPDVLQRTRSPSLTVHLLTLVSVVDVAVL